MITSSLWGILNLVPRSCPGEDVQQVIGHSYTESSQLEIQNCALHRYKSMKLSNETEWGELVTSNG